MTKLERMSDFFTKRIGKYENKMLNDVYGCKEGYIRVSEILPDNCKKLLDLGCGTGLELRGIFEKIPDLKVVGIDLTQVMLDKLKQNFPGKNLELICRNFFDVSFGEKAFDCVISFQAMHHFSHEKKISLYEKIRKALKLPGMYIEGDYVAKDQREEDILFSELSRIRNEQNIGESEFVHFDIPCTVENQIKMFKLAGFKEVKKIWQKGNTAIIVGKAC